MLIHPLHSEFCLYQKTFKNNTLKTILWFEEIFKYFTEQMDIIQIHQVNHQVLKPWFIKGKLEKKWSAKTIRNRMTALSIFFKYCVKEGYMEENPILRLDKPRLEKRIPEHLSVEEASYLLEWLKCSKFTYVFEKTRALAIIATFLYTGIRLSELLNLKVSEVRFDEKIIFIKAGKGNKDRTLPMIGRLSDYLNAYGKHRKYSIYFFTSIRKKGTMSPTVIKRLFKRICDKTDSHNAHKLRHSFAVQMLEGGCDIYAFRFIGSFRY